MVVGAVRSSADHSPLELIPMLINQTDSVCWHGGSLNLLWDGSIGTVLRLPRCCLSACFGLCWLLFFYYYLWFLVWKWHLVTGFMNCWSFICLFQLSFFFFLFQFWVHCYVYINLLTMPVWSQTFSVAFEASSVGKTLSQSLWNFLKIK